MLYFVIVENVLMNRFEDTLLFGGNANTMEVIPAYVNRPKKKVLKQKVFILPGASKIVERPENKQDQNIKEDKKYKTIIKQKESKNK
jgi:hypothetical protein